MAEQEAIEALAAELAKSVDLIMDPGTKQQVRLEAHMACERFKEQSPNCAQVGLFLAATESFNRHVRHFGLILVEHTIKLHWEDMTNVDKNDIKENSIEIISGSIGPAENKAILSLKVGIARIMVEIIKREWPQQWNTLLPELFKACNNGDAQTELVLLVLLRLVEDVALLQTIESNQRRKDMYQALNDNMAEIFVFFLGLVELHVNAYRETTRLVNINKANAHSRLVELALRTLNGFVEWVHIDHIMSSNGKLLRFLCILLNDQEFQCDAAECLAQIANRKGQTKDRKPLLHLFEEESLRYICTSSQMTASGSSASAFVQAIEQQHNFLKKLLQVLHGMVEQLVTLWGTDDSIQRPAHLDIMFECLLQLVQHPSLTVAHGSALIWQLLLKHDGCSKDHLMIHCIPKLLHIIAPRIMKMPYPCVQAEAPASTAAYIRLDYCEEEFVVYFYRCRNDFLKIFSLATRVQPLIAFNFCAQWLQSRLQNTQTKQDCANICCNILDPIYLEWDALICVLESVVNRILLVEERPELMDGLRLLEECLKQETNNPLTYSLLLSCISALFVFIGLSSSQLMPNNHMVTSGVSLVPRVLEKIFLALVLKPPNELDKVQLKSANNLKQHAASLLLKLSQKYPLLLLPFFEQINYHVECLMQEPAPSAAPQLWYKMRLTFQEALMLLSNHFCDFERQSIFINHIIERKRCEWLSFVEAFQSPLEFIQFVGLNKPPELSIHNDVSSVNCLRILDAIYVLLGIIKRCTWPDDFNRAQNGGFFINCAQLGIPIRRNPATQHVMPLLPHVLSLMRVLNELFTTQGLAGLSEGYRNVYAMMELDKKMLMGICNIPADPLDTTIQSESTAFAKMQNFVTLVTDGCYHLMGSAGPSLGPELYQCAGLADAIIRNVFSCMNIIPDYRIRPIIRVFLKPFLYACHPSFNETVLVPLFAHLAPLMCERLAHRWTYISSLYESGQLNDLVSDTQEVIDDQVNRALTREYIDLLKIALAGRQFAVDLAANVLAQGNEQPNTPQLPGIQTVLISDNISDLGGKLLRHSSIGNYILRTLLNAIVWNDGISNLKAVTIVAPVMRFLVAEQLVDQNIAVSALTAVLQGIQVHGQHVPNLAGLVKLGVQFYELLRPKFAILSELLQRIPNVKAADVQKFDEKISVVPVAGNRVDRSKKDIFKKLTAQLIGPSVNTLFRLDIHIADLPSIQPKNQSNNQSKR